MDWEIFDLDGDEIVIRKSQTAWPWGELPSSKRLPRSAGSVNRARRCEQVQELIRFCEDQDTTPSSSRRNTVKQDASCDEISRDIRAMASVPNLRGATGGQKHSKPKLRLRAVLSRERSPEGGRFQMLQCPIFKNSTTSLHMATSPKGSLSSPIAGRSSSVGGKGVDCECYYPGVAMLPSVRNSMVSFWRFPSTISPSVEESAFSWGSVGSLIGSRRKAMMGRIKRTGIALLKLVRRWTLRALSLLRDLLTPGPREEEQRMRLHMAQALLNGQR